MRKKMICFTMACLLMISAATPKKAYAIAGVDDVAVAIVLALTAAAGITFATSDGAKDAVKDFLKSSDGKYDSTLEKLSASAVTAGGLSCFKIPVATWAGVKLLLEGLFDYFKTDENRKGAVKISSGVLGFPFVLRADDPKVKSFFKLEISPSTFPVYLLGCYSILNSDHGRFIKIRYFLCADYQFEYTYLSTYRDEYGVGHDQTVYGKASSYHNTSGLYFYMSNSLQMADFYSDFSSFFGVSWDSLPEFDHYKAFHGDKYWDSVFRAICSDSVASAEKSIPYGLTFPKDMTAPDVIDNFEQKVKEGAGDTAIAVPVDGVVDGTLPYDVAQEKYLVNVNELGEIGDTVTETNTWLQKILSSVKAIPAAVSSAVVGTGTLDFSGFQNIGLSTVFPFCIPFDLKNALIGFNVSPAEPIWEISFDGTFMSAAGSFVLDFTKFEKLFAIVRFFIYGGFVVSLILITRKIIKG